MLTLIPCLPTKVDAGYNLSVTSAPLRTEPFYFGADAESFAILPTDYSRLTNMNSSDGIGFSDTLRQLGRPVLRFASMQRWDWRGEFETRALVASSFNQRLRQQKGYQGAQTDINYHYVSAQHYFEFCKKNHITTIPMLDVGFFYDSALKQVQRCSTDLAAASKQYAAGYTSFVKRGGYDVLLWEIGNEEYLPQYQFSPEEYVLVTKAYIKAVLEVDPNAKFGIQLYLADLAPEWKSWSIAVLDGLKDYSDHIDYACLHYYHYKYFRDSTTDAAMEILRKRGYLRTKIALTEWRPGAAANDDDQQFKSASLYSRYLMFALRSPAIGVACVHAFPLFGGLAEWSDGRAWTSYTDSGSGQRRRDTAGQPRWRILPFGHAQRMIMDATRGNQLVDFQENPGKLSLYLYRKPKGGYSLIIVNEGRSAVSDTISIRYGALFSRITGRELFCADPEAFPRDSEPQPWSVNPVRVAGGGSLAEGSVFLLTKGVIKASVRPYAVVTLDLQ